MHFFSYCKRPVAKQVRPQHEKLQQGKRRFVKQAEREPPRQNREPHEQLTDYIHYIIDVILTYEETIPDFAAIGGGKWFEAIDRAASAVQFLRADLIKSIFKRYETAFTRSLDGKKTLLLPGIEKYFRICRRILDFHADKQLPLSPATIQDAITDISGGKYLRTWNGASVSAALGWLAKACSHSQLLELVQRAEVKTFVVGGVERMVTHEEDPSAHAPFMGDYVLSKVEDMMQDPNPEVQIVGARLMVSCVGTRMGNTLLATNIDLHEVREVALPELRVSYPPRQPSMSEYEAVMATPLVQQWRVPHAAIRLGRTKTSPQGRIIHVPLVDSKRRSCVDAFRLWAQQIEKLRAAGIKVSAPAKVRKAHNDYNAFVREHMKKPWPAPTTTPARANGFLSGHLPEKACWDFLKAPPSEGPTDPKTAQRTPYLAATKQDLQRELRAVAYIAWYEESRKPLDQQSPHFQPKFPVTKLTGHSCRRLYSTSLAAAGVDVTAINAVMDWSNKDMNRMVQTYNANATGLELGTRLKAAMLWGSTEFRCPLPEDPAAQSELIFPDHKQWFFMHMQPEKPFTNRLRQTWREATLPPPARPDWDGGEPSPNAPDERTPASAVEQPLVADAKEQPSAEATPNTVSVPLTAEGAMIGAIHESADEWARIGTAVGTMLAGHPLGTAMTSIAALARALDETEGEVDHGLHEAEGV